MLMLSVRLHSQQSAIDENMRKLLTWLLVYFFHSLEFPKYNSSAMSFLEEDVSVTE